MKWRDDLLIFAGILMGLGIAIMINVWLHM